MVETASARTPIATATGRSIGALFFTGFGTVWLLLGFYAFGLLHRTELMAILAVAALAVVLALRLHARSSRLASSDPSTPQRLRDDRVFLWINVAQGAAIFLLLSTLPRMGHQEIAIAAVVIVVGVHFLAMPPSYRYRSNLVLGWCMVAWGALCAIVFRGDRMIAFAALGAGLMLWCLAGWALHTASTTLRRLSA